MTKYALRWADENFVEYTPYLCSYLPSLEEKMEVLGKMRDEAAILVTDYRGFRGCEAEHCICFVNLDDLYGDHILVEILTRAVSRFLDKYIFLWFL